MNKTAWRRRSVTLADQVLSSVSNVLVVLLVAQAVNPTEFGHFALGYAVLTVTLGLTRAYFGTRISLAPDRQAARRLTAALVGGLLFAAPPVSLLVFGASMLATSGQAPLVSAVIAAATPVVCLQDILRFGAAAGNRPWAALLSDAAWIGGMAVPFVFGLELDAPAALALWACCAALALVIALVAFRERPLLREGLAEVRRTEAVAASLLVGAVLTSCASLLTLFVVARVLGPAAAGSLRGASTAMGPVNVLLAFLVLGVTPVLVRRGRGRDHHFCSRLAVVAVALVLAWGTVLLLLPPIVGEAAFGSSWQGIRGVLTWTVVEYVWVAVGAAAVMGLKVRRHATDLVRSRIVSAVSTVGVGTAAAAVLQDVTAVAAGLALSALLTAATAWLLLLRTDHQEGRRVERVNPSAGTVAGESKWA